MLRRFGLICFSIILTPLLLAVVALHAADDTVMDPNKQKQYLVQAQFYPILKEEMVNEIVDRTFSNPEGLLTKTISGFFRTIVNDAVDEQLLQSKTEEVLDSLHAYLNNDRDDQVITFDIRDLKQTLLLKMNEVLEQQGQGMPIPSQYTTNRIIEDLSGYIPNEIDLVGLFIESDDLNDLKMMYGGYKISFTIVYTAIAIVVGIGLLIAASLKTGFIWLGVNCFISGGILLILTGIRTITDESIEWYLDPEYIAYQPVIEQFIKAALKDMGSVLVNGSGILIAAGVLCMVLSNYFYRRNRHRTV
ncbi:hypothetical protein [Marinicrinis lubricantis]|uniref:Uncharacterized protein n=1 Tax=Marinicrinis lubricantis TaxID=2086470 RepID=A0ABW1IT90_9BACL